MKNILPKKVYGGLRRAGTMWTTVIAITLITGTMMIPKYTEASCFYNKTDKKDVTFNFYCGWFCHNDWKIHAGGHECRPGKGGFVHVFTSNSKGYCQLDVAKHGWVEVHDVSSKGVIESKDDNGNTTQTCVLDW